MHTQQSVRTLLKSITSIKRTPTHSSSSYSDTGAAESGADLRGAQWKIRSKGLCKSKASSHKARTKTVSCVNLHQPICNASVHVTCCLCRTDMSSMECDYIYNSTMLKHWMALCPLCSMTIEDRM